MLYIDAFNHILPKKYQAVLEQKVPNRDMSSNLSRYAETVPTLLDLDARFPAHGQRGRLHAGAYAGGPHGGIRRLARSRRGSVLLRQR